MSTATDTATLTCPSCGTDCASEHRYCPSCGFPMEKLHEQPDDPLLGCTLPGGHVVLELIDVGGMGRVYRAEQKMLGRTVAVKIIHPHLLGDETVEARFITEARAASQLNHPNSVGVIDFGKFEGRLYMVMEYLRGRDLATVAHEEGPLELDRIIDILNQTLAALEEAHHVGIIHRDLKPENIVLSPLRSGGDFVKVLDFGLAKVLQVAQIASNRRITDPGMVCGTPEYMAPEQARGDDIDHRADLYACGVLLYELLAGALPFEGASPREVVLLHLSQLPPDLYIMAPDRKMPPALVDVVMKALAKDPDDRFQSASQLADALNRAMGPAKTKSKSQSLVQCPSCSAMMPLRQKFCGECGSSMTPSVPEASPSQPAAEEASDEIPQFPLRFVGREAELSRLTELRGSASSSLVAVRVAGQAGVGKTRLIDEFVAQSSDKGDIVARATPDPWWSNKGYYALRECVRQLAKLPEDGGGPKDWPGAASETRAGLEAIFDQGRPGGGSNARRRWSETPPLSPEGQGSRRALAAEALRWAIGQARERIEGEARVVIAVDDLHGIDGASRNAFADVVIEPPLDAVLLLASHAPDFESGWDGAEEVELKGLPTTTAVKLLGGDDDDDGMRRAAESETASHMPEDNGKAKRVSPMYVEQLRRFSLEGGEDPPPKLADLIALRIERLPADARRVLQAVAVLGDQTSLTQLQAVLPNSQGVPGHVEQLDEEGFLRPAGEDGTPSFSTTHPLVRDVCLASMPAAVRTTLHSRALMARPGGVNGSPLEAEANHAYHAGASFEALMLLERVADQARDRDDVSGMVTALHRALELARREMMVGELDDPVAAVLMFSTKLGDALAAVGKQTDAEGVLTEALNLAGPSSPERSRILASLANVARGRGRADAAYQRLDEAVRIAEKANHPDLLEMLESTRQLWIQGNP